MAFWFIMLGSNLLLPVIMLVGGRLFLSGSPKKINSFYGYRTTLSMKNEDTWRFAHACAGKYLWKWGWISLPFAILPMLPLLGQPEDPVAIASLIILCVLMVPIFGVILHTEKALRQTFDEDGYRRPQP